jgi:hypothetical protein
MPAYGYGGPPPMREPAWTPEQQWQNDQRDQQDAYNRWLQAQSLGMQLAGQQYQNAAQGVQNLVCASIQGGNPLRARQ